MKNDLKTKIVYFDESGDDGNNTDSSKYFVLTSTSVETTEWQNIFNAFVEFRRKLKNDFGLHVTEELHSKCFFYDKDPYRKYGWTPEQRRQIMIEYIKFVSSLNISVVNVVIKKENIKNKDYDVLEKALTYNIQRIENDSKDTFKYLIITDQGRTAAMRKTARKIRVINQVQSKYDYSSHNEPITNLIEDILEKDSKESYFIQISDLISTIVNMYYNYYMNNNPMPKRLQNVIDRGFIGSAMETFKTGGILNLSATKSNKYGIVAYPNK